MTRRNILILLAMLVDFIGWLALLSVVSWLLGALVTGS